MGAIRFGYMCWDGELETHTALVSVLGFLRQPNLQI
jgi:hypothetical protein